MSRLDKAIADFEDETLNLTLGERLLGLNYALMDIQFERLKMANNRDKDFDEEAERIITIMKWLKEMNKTYTLNVRMCKLTGKTNDDFKKEWMDSIHKMKSSVGDIVRDIRQDTNGVENN